MGSKIEITGYVVGFGDCVLLSIPDGADVRHILIDFGRAPNDAASVARFPAIARDIQQRTGGHLDLVIATHEHLDHIEGFYRERSVFDAMTVDQVWMGLPSHPDYYTDFPAARLQKRLQGGLPAFMRNARTRGIRLHPGFQSLLENNLSNKDRVNYLRKLGRKPPQYLARGARVQQPFRNIKFTVLAPEKDVSSYYTVDSRARAMSQALAAGGNDGPSDEGYDWTFPKVARAGASQLGGISASDYARLRRAIHEDGVRSARFIDKAGNNTSLCLLIEAAGKRLLLPGDAELESWDIMARKCPAELGKPVDFLKVSHHGSHNGTPLEMLDRLLPVSRRAKAQAFVSTKRNVYGDRNPVPDTSLMDDLRQRCHKLVTTDGEPGTSLQLTL